MLIIWQRIQSNQQPGYSSQPIYFERSFAQQDGLLVSADKVYGDNQNLRSFYVVELKVYTDKKLLMEAMRYTMLQFPVLQTTYGKKEMVDSINGSC